MQCAMQQDIHFRSARHSFHSGVRSKGIKLYILISYNLIIYTVYYTAKKDKNVSWKVKNSQFIKIKSFGNFKSRIIMEMRFAMAVKPDWTEAI